MLCRSDWERVIVVWSAAGDGNAGTWQPAQLLLSQHTGYGRLDWAKIQNTFNAEDAARARGGVNGRTGLDHPKVRTNGRCCCCCCRGYPHT